MQLFNIIKNKKEYWLVDQIKVEDVVPEIYQNQFQQLLNEWEHREIGYLSLLMEETFEEWLVNHGFRKISSIVEYTRTLDHLPETNSGFIPHALSDGEIRDEEYANYYQLARSGSANKNIQQPIQTVMNTIAQELGTNWREHCFYFTKTDAVVGIAIPHIEMGTVDEGRMFYFGVLPKWRGKGIGIALHKYALHLLPKFGATYYVGSTDTHNTKMIKIFEKNGCTLKNRKGIYRIERRR